MVEEWEAAETRKIKKTGGMKPGVVVYTISRCSSDSCNFLIADLKNEKNEQVKR